MPSSNRFVAGMRDRLIHDYIGVDHEIVWYAVRKIIPALFNEIVDILDKEN
jgi:uncharacterized protein with HEPN domain